MTDCRTLTELIASRKNLTDQGITFIRSDTEEVYVSYQELYITARKLLYDLQKAGFQQGDEIIFQIDDNQKFVYSFWACVMGGMIPVPISTGANDEHKLKLFKIWDILNNPRIVATRDFLEKLYVFAEKENKTEKIALLKNRAVYVEDAIQSDNDGVIYDSNPEDIAFIQFSSGSTGDPKGVVITHRNVIVNLSSVIQWEKIDSTDTGLNWMPLTHDMGLIGTHIKGLLAGMNQYNIQTQSFIRHPSLWIQKASEHKATILYSPNFGYKHLLKFLQPRVKRDWDLSNVRLIYNGAEPISLDLCNEFLDRMSEYHLKREAMHPVFGLAEGTIAVTFPYPEEKMIFHTLDRNHLKVGEAIVDLPKEDHHAVTFVDVGYPIYNCYVRICDEDNRDLGENMIGYIQIRGGNVTSGYYNNQAATKEAIKADGWLNTGDLGFLRNQRLTITGRAKDVIFMAGQNLYSHDIERIAEEIEGIELGKIVAVGVFNEKVKSDELILFVLFKQKLENFIPLALNLKKLLNQKVGIEASEVIPVKNIPKTTSGKVQRYKLRESYLKGEFDLVIRESHSLMAEEFEHRQIDRPQNEVEETLVKLWLEVLEQKEIGIYDNFFELGGDSLKITQLISRINDDFGVTLDQATIFDNPEIAKLAGLIIHSKKESSDKQDRIMAGNETDQLVLSYAQRRLWFLDRLHNQSPQYNLCAALLLRGNLDREALTRSLHAILTRHQVLRMSFTEKSGEPVQILNPDPRLSIGYVDLRNLPPAERETKAMELSREEAGLPFYLEVAPLMRGKLISCDESEHILVLAAHHIIFDGWSFGILLKELALHYEAFVNGESLTLAPLTIQYQDYAKWQVERVQQGSLQTQIEYWKKQLNGKLPVLDLPLDKQRPAIQTYHGAKFTGCIAPELANDLKTYARKENATLFMVTLAAFKLLLYRYTGQPEIIIGSPIANRNRKEVEGLIGFFTNNIVLRSHFSGDLRFSELLKKIKNVTLEASFNQDIPFEKLVEELHVERDMSRNPLFQILFSLQNAPMPKVHLTELNISMLDIDTGYARFDLAVDLQELGEGLSVSYEYNTDLFNDATLVRLAGHYRQLLMSIVKNPDERLDHFEILTFDEKSILLDQWNHTAADFGEISNWVELFEKQAYQKQDHIAVVCNNQSITYGELDRRANRLAHYLRTFGIGPESIVGIFIERSIAMLVGLLGVHKAGAAYLPMDPIFPRERLHYMIEDAGVKIVLTEQKLKELLPVNDAKLILLDGEWDLIASYSAAKPVVDTQAHDLAYVIYTSGSTGKPKGVQIEQYSLINFLSSMAHTTGINEKDALLAVTTLSFDIAGLELYMPLITGAKVIVAARDEVGDGKRLIDIIEKQSVTIMQATPATWRLLITSGWTGGHRVKVLCGGEALPKNLAEQILERAAILYNVYGPTETTIWSTISKVETGAGAAFIGRPISNTQIYVLDKSMKPVPIGIPGELFIGGDGLARGYLNLPGLTEEKFIPNPYYNEKFRVKSEEFRVESKEQTHVYELQQLTRSSEHSTNKNSQLSTRNCQLIYKTGDLVKFSVSGELEFIGRVDHQVKIRGFRIELGEIEALLNQDPHIKESVVAVKEIITGEKSLVAYLIPGPKQGEPGLNADYLRKSLKEKLPDYMIPVAFVMMESFPMTPNGKIDRNALPAPENLRSGLTADYAAPSNDIEDKVALIWQEVLKVERIGVNDNFFDLGGHSLLLAQVRSKIGTLLNKEISMMDLFKYPTIGALSRFLSGDYQTVGPENAPRRKASADIKNRDIAIIGLSGRFPGAKDIEEFWNNLAGGVESISFFSDAQIIAEGINPAFLQKPGYVKAWGVLESVDKFDAPFFGYNPREAEILDPQQRIFLEESWKALENAGYDSERYHGLIGVYASVGMNHYAKNLTNHDDSDGLANDYQVMISNDKDFLATRIAYKMNLEGPGVTVQTACSSSLVAVHLACQSLINHECDMALAGGVSIRLPQQSGYLYQEGMILSPDGHCRAFDEQAKGTVGGNGAGVVVLKRLEDALADGDTISAVIKGSAINNDGAQKVGYTAPRIEGQAKVIAEAQLKAGIEPGTITYIEAHGTGTPLGDPIEIEALTKTFNQKTDRRQFCAMGSVKTNIGHLDAAAGITGLIKVVLSLRHKQLPPSLHYRNPNPKINFKESPFYVNSSLASWTNEAGPLRAAVSSFGIGGTNAHLVLEEAPGFTSDPQEPTPYLLVFSAKSKEALHRLTRGFGEFLGNQSEINLADLAYTLQLGRREFEWRSFLICHTVAEAIRILQNGGDLHESRLGSGSERQAAPNISSVINDPHSYPLDRIGNMWLGGVMINWSKLYEGQRRKRIALPTYPFEGKSYWVRKNTAKADAGPQVNDVKQIPFAEWFYTPIWKQSLTNVFDHIRDNETEKDTVLILADQHDFTRRLIHYLKTQNPNIIVAVSGDGYQKVDNDSYIINVEEQRLYHDILRELSEQGKVPARMINLLGITAPECRLTATESMQSGKRLFYSMLYLAQAIGSQTWHTPVQIKIITNNSQKIFNETVLYPEKALHLGACRVIPREYPNITCGSIDILLPEPGSTDEEDLLRLLAAEVHATDKEDLVAYRGLERWRQEFEKITLDGGSRSGVTLKDNGVYMITGGMGGIGLTMAEYLAREHRAKLVLVGRSAFPDAEEWEQWMATHPEHDPITQKIVRLRQCQALGAEISIHRADVMDTAQLRELRREVETRYGVIHGIIHAAGFPGGGLVQRKTNDSVERVFGPKVSGTVALYEVFKDCGLEFMALCSSLNAITGGFGQVDYSAANVYLDAFAQTHDRRGGTRVISIDWDRWPGIGMAAESGLPSGLGTGEAIHPLLGRRLADHSQRIVFANEMSPEKDWVLSEHLVIGVPTIAGATYLEMARAAFTGLSGNRHADITEVLFLNPLAVQFGEKRNIYTIIEPYEDGFNFRVISEITGGEGGKNHWSEHARGKIAPSGSHSVQSFDLQELKQRCNRKEIVSSGEKRRISQEFIRFGPRWESLQELTLGDTEALVEIGLSQDYLEDLNLYKLHPALMDVATGAVRLVTGGNYLPFSYEKLAVRADLPGRFHSYIRFKNALDSAQEIITCDIDIFGEDGVLLVEITKFSMKLVSEAAASGIRSRSSGDHRSEEISLEELLPELTGVRSGLLDQGITPAEGREAFGRILKGFFRSQIIVSTKDIQAAIAQANYIGQPNLNRSLTNAAAKERHPRPELDNEYVPPKSDIDKKLAEIWQNTLGIDSIGIHDEFFALGGDSLLLIQLHTKVKETFSSDIAVVDLYKYNTVALLSKYFNRSDTVEDQPAFTEVNNRANKQLELMKQKRQQMQQRKGVK